MSDNLSVDDLQSRIRAAGWPAEQVNAWLSPYREFVSAHGRADEDWRTAGSRLGSIVAQGWALLRQLPPRSRRNDDEGSAADSLRLHLVEMTRRYCRRHRRALYEAARGGRQVTPRLDELVEAAAGLLPDVFPSTRKLSQEAASLQKDKDGLELLQGALVSEWLADAETGAEIIQAMRRPLAAGYQLAQRLRESGRVELERLSVEVNGRLGRIEFNHPATLNAEDESTLPEFEQAVDALLLHPAVQMGVLRGGPVDHPKYRGRRLFSAGINLTALYQGRQSYLWYLVRELGVLNKIYRGLVTEAHEARDESGSHEIPWMAVVEGFAIGGGCQILLVADHVLAEHGAYFNLPARKEGIIPGCANLRMPRFMGLRATQSAILFGQEFRVEEPAAAGLINSVCASDEMDNRIDETARLALDSGMVSAAGNRRALRCVGESIDDFRDYLSVYAWEQAWCHLSPKLAANLERHWKKAHPKEV